MKYINQFYFLLLFACCTLTLGAQQKIKVLNFQADHGFQHESKKVGLELIQDLGVSNNWEVVTSIDTATINTKTLELFDVVVFNNNCGNEGAIFSKTQHQALQNYIRNGGGFVGIHCAGAIWKEDPEFQQWYEKLVGTRLEKHPKVQKAILRIENNTHVATSHLPKTWELTDEWHSFSHNPRNKVNVLLSLDENSYEGTPKMGGDHPFTWYQYFDGGRSFFTSLGHTVEIYKDENYKKLIRGAILWASSKTDQDSELPVLKSLMLDLNPDEGVTLEKGNKISFWQNSVTDNEVKSFKKQDKGRKIPGSGMPRLKLNVPELNGHNSVVFHRQELLNENEDAFDHLTQGSGYTWLSVMAVYEQVPGKPGVNSFFGNLRNTNLDKQGNYEGFWAGLNEENQLWMGSRNAKGNGLWHVDSPHVINPSPLNTIQYYLVIGRMQAGTNNAKMELFVNGTTPVAEGVFPVNPNANPSKMAIGQERDATNHPGHESFDGEIARFLIYDRPLLNNELNIITNYLIQKYNIQ